MESGCYQFAIEGGQAGNRMKSVDVKIHIKQKLTTCIPSPARSP